MKRLIIILILIISSAINCFAKDPYYFSPKPPYNNYIGNCLSTSNLVARFKNSTISFYIRPSAKTYEQHIYEVIKELNNTFTGLISFKKAESENNANIIYDVRDAKSLAPAVGLTNIEYDRKEGNILYVKLAKIYIAEDLYITNKAPIRQVIIHETLHAIGVSRHSPSKKDIMYKQSTKENNQKLSSRDINSIRIIYSNNQKFIESALRSYDSKLDDEYFKSLIPEEDKIKNEIKANPYNYELLVKYGDYFYNKKKDYYSAAIKYRSALDMAGSQSLYASQAEICKKIADCYTKLEYGKEAQSYINLAKLYEKQIKK